MSEIKIFQGLLNRNTWIFQGLFQGLLHWRPEGGKSTIEYLQWHCTPVLLPGESHGWRSLVGCSPWGRKELDMTEQLHFHFSLSWIGKGNGNPLQCSCLENPRDGEPGGPLSMGSHRVTHDWSDLATATAVPIQLQRFCRRWGSASFSIACWLADTSWSFFGCPHGQPAWFLWELLGLER